MKKLCLVLFVCLSVQLNAVSAPFLHLHADEAHATDHHDGAVVHRHLSTHAAAPGHHQLDHASAEIQDADDSSSIDSSDGAAAIAIGGLTARLAAVGAPVAPPAGVAELLELPRPAIPPDDDVGDSLPDSPDHRSSSHRGPPR